MFCNGLLNVTQNIFLVGLMGAGKTTVGRFLAKKLNWRFVDSDHEIEARAGASVSWIFEIEGEASFRRREAEVIRELSAQSNIVLATGGGAVLDAQTRQYLSERGQVVYLRVSVHSILQRTAHDKSRPLLQVANPRSRLTALMAQRDPLYREIADIIIDSGGAHVHSMVAKIMNRLDLSVTSSKNSFVPMAPTQLAVDLGERSYPIVIGQSLLGDANLFAQHIAGNRVVIVTNVVVAPLYAERVTKSLEAAGKEVLSVVLADGEQEKNWTNLMHIFEAMLFSKCDRKTTLLALGGGVIGDLTGFAAATYMRGVDFIGVPTTLLSQVDSSVGGKTGINHALGKNMIGAFYQPRAVITDITVLDTLPMRELSAGLAEIIKMAAIGDGEFFAWLENNIEKLMRRESEALVYAIRRSCEMKADIVRQDERESGIRATLNFGHTFGHAIESGLGYGEWLHGEAVGCGMVMAADLSQRLGLLDQDIYTRLVALIKAAGLPVVAPDLGRERWVELMAVDKKNDGGKIKFIVLDGLGRAILTSVDHLILQATLDAAVIAR